MVVLLVSLRRWRRRGVSEERQDQTYRPGNFSETLMRHFLLVGPLPGGVALRAFPAPLVAAPGRSQ
jgi:hypothetical protein